MMANICFVIFQLLLVYASEWEVRVNEINADSSYVLKVGDVVDFQEILTRHNALILFISSDAKHNCDFCSTFASDMDELAKEYRSKQSDLVFFTVDYAVSLEVFKLLKVKSVPWIAFSNNNQLSFTKLSRNSKLVDFIYAKETSTAQVEASVNRILLFLILIGFGSILNMHYKTLIKFLYLKTTWMFGSMFVLFLSMSGSMYTFLRGAPPFYVGSAGIYLIHPNGKQQFGFEGWIIGASYFIGASVVLFLLRGLRYVQGRDAKAQALGLAVFVFFFVFQIPFLNFCRKNSWYRL